VANVTVIGAQWGDEGKGKIVDWLASRADMVVRFQGGHNAGHTLVVDGKTYKLSLLPSGIVTGTPSVIGNGVVLDPWALKAEVERIREQGVKVTPEILMIAETCPLILPIHRDLDGLRYPDFHVLANEFFESVCFGADIVGARQQEADSIITCRRRPAGVDNSGRLIRGAHLDIGKNSIGFISDAANDRATGRPRQRTLPAFLPRTGRR